MSTMKPLFVYPHFTWWSEDRVIPGGKKVEFGMEYSSETNTEG